MKLIFCRKCRGSIGFVDRTISCSCGSVMGKYLDQDNVVWCEKEENIGIPFAVDNHSFFARAGKDEMAQKVNEIYDQWYGSGKIQAWLFNGPDSPGFNTIKKLPYDEFMDQVEGRKQLKDHPRGTC